MHNKKKVITYLSECAFNLAKIVIIRYLRCVIVEVINFETQTLNFLKKVIQLKWFGKLWT